MKLTYWIVAIVIIVLGYIVWYSLDNGTDTTMTPVPVTQDRTLQGDVPLTNMPTTTPTTTDPNIKG